MNLTLYSAGFYVCLSLAAALLSAGTTGLIRLGKPGKAAAFRYGRKKQKEEYGFRITEHVVKACTDEKQLF